MTRHFRDFGKEITPLVKSLPSIIHHKDEIINILEKHLKVKDSMALDGLLEYVLLSKCRILLCTNVFF
jgi:U3 small nucleolar RNA-associated protein 20